MDDQPLGHVGAVVFVFVPGVTDILGPLDAGALK
jgi:hypothetical protein